MIKRIALILTVLMLVSAVFCGCEKISPSGEDTVTADIEKNTDKSPDTTVADTEPDTTAVPETTKAPETTAAETTSAPETTAPVETAPSVPTGNYSDNPTVFDDALFIGDSRTVGITMYGNIGTADVFANVGLNSFRVLTETIDGHTLEQLLKSKQYKSILIMLGINEIGYNLDSIMGKYSEAVNKIVELQPNATVYIEANLHIKGSRSAVDDVFNNTRLNDLNNRMKALCNGSNIKYLDVNPLFDDANGALNPNVASDDFHPNAPYYIEWCNWLADSIK